MGLYDKYARLAGERLQFSDNGLTPFGTCIDEVYSATEGRIGNKKVILAGTNNYLGLTFNHDAIAEGQAALAAQGTGTTGSRMANGSYAPHLALEKEIARVQQLACIQAKLFDCEMIQHRFLDHSLRRQQAVYSDGTVITVDFERNTYSIRRVEQN